MAPRVVSPVNFTHGFKMGSPVKRVITTITRVPDRSFVFVKYRPYSQNLARVTLPRFSLIGSLGPKKTLALGDFLPNLNVAFTCNLQSLMLELTVSSKVELTPL